ncbi:MAG: ABC transporter substrate-binding protein [Propionibacteriaceae bacterium]|jgi:raffinose/stachyose/melibiose transport system substrate-binding protein|nr:ABC transporter substrate-binding protein [Propionibacteriaceae bacterium]
MRKRLLALALAATMALGTVACTGGGDTPSVYFLNFKPEVAEVYNQIVAAYKEEKNIDVKVVTAASGTYEQTLTSEIAKSEPPTIFQINGPVGYANWKDYVADVSDSELYKHMIDKSQAITDGGKTYGIPYVVEGFGIIYNEAIMKKYFGLANKAVSISATTEIKDFATLKQVAEDMTKHKAELGIKGVFSNTSLKPGEDWRWQTHLADVPFYYEFTEDKIDLNKGTPAQVTFKYGPQYQSLFDLYLNNSTTEKGQLGSKTVDEAMAEFALGQSAMVQNGNWGWGQIAIVQGNTVKAEDVHFLPLYTGVTGEDKQGICIGTENYFAINNDISDASKKASLDFLYWLFSSETGKKYVTEQLRFITPFDTFTAKEVPNDPLATEVRTWMDNKEVKNLPWVFTVFPSQQFKDDFGGALLQYAQGKTDWAKVSSTVVDSWKTQAAAAEGS